MAAPSTPPLLEGIEHRSVRLHSRGIAMHVAEAGSGATVILLHGAPQHWYEWRRVIPRLEAGHRLIAPDLRGAGWSDAPDGGYDASSQVDDVLALLDALGVDRAVLVTHDYSAFLGWRLAFEHTDRVAGVVALGSPHPWSGVTPRMLGRLWRTWFQLPIVSPLGPALLSGGRQRLVRHMIEGYVRGLGGCEGDDLEVFLAPLREPARARAPARTYRALIIPEMLSMSRRWQHARLTVPTRILLGERDPIMATAATDDVRGRADDLRIDRVSDAAHYLASERPDAVAAAVRELTG